MLTNATWNVLSKVMCLSGRIYNKTDHRKTFEGILYKMRTVIPWLDLPSYFGTWSAIYRRFNLWSKKDILSKANGENPKEYSWLSLVTRCVVKQIKKDRHIFCVRRFSTSPVVGNRIIIFLHTVSVSYRT